MRHLFGTWHEAMFCGQEEGDATCVWQAGMLSAAFACHSVGQMSRHLIFLICTAAMPADSNQYYGFNQFAIQLNGFEEGMRDKLPHCDSRFRPDQRSTHMRTLFKLFTCITESIDYDCSLWFCSRLLEEGYIEQAEQEKLRVEQVRVYNALLPS